MPFLDQLQRSVDLAKFKANQLGRINNLQNDIVNVTGEIQSIRKQIVEVTLQLHRNNNELPPQLDAMCKQIVELESRIADIGQVINSVRSEVYNAEAVTSTLDIVDTDILKCSHCNMKVPAGSEFCTHCGMKI